MVDLIAGIVVASILGLAIFYIVKAKKAGQKCIGCPHSKTCASCGCESKNKKAGESENKKDNIQ